MFNWWSNNYDDDETGLYGQSALYIFSLYLQEQHENEAVQDSPAM